MSCVSFINNISVLTQSGESVYSNCAQIVLINQGQSAATINGVLRLLPGESFTMPGAMNFSELDLTVYTVYFDDNTVVNKLVVVQKLYKESL